jgi:hypothetical protein
MLKSLRRRAWEEELEKSFKLKCISKCVEKYKKYKKRHVLGNNDDGQKFVTMKAICTFDTNYNRTKRMGNLITTFLAQYLYF